MPAGRHRGGQGIPASDGTSQTGGGKMLSSGYILQRYPAFFEGVDDGLGAGADL
jgi:hypothetical protein